MTGICSLALLALQSTSGLPPGAGVDALHRFGVEGEYLPKARTLATDGGDTYVVSTATAFGMRSWTRTKLDPTGSVVWSHSDYQFVQGTSNPSVAGLFADARVAPSAGLLISAQVDARDGGTYRILAHNLTDGSEVWSYEPSPGPSGLEVSPNASAQLLVDDSAGLLYQIFAVNGQVRVRKLDLQTGSVLTVKNLLSEFDGATLIDVELSADGQRLYFAARVATNDVFLTDYDGIGLALDTGTGVELWRVLDPVRDIVEVEEQPGTHEVALLASVFDGDTRLWAVDSLTGVEAWSRVYPGPAKPPAEMQYTADGAGLIVASGQPLSLFPTVAWEPGAVLERFDSTDGAQVWERNVVPQGILGQGAFERMQLAVHPDGTVLWS
jgi:outer membrane protein assembly factor BamB